MRPESASLTTVTEALEELPTPERAVTPKNKLSIDFYSPRVTTNLTTENMGRETQIPVEEEDMKMFSVVS